MFVYLHSILFIYLYREKIFVAIKVVKSAGQYTETAHDEITLLMRVCMPFGISLNSLDNADSFLFSSCKKKIRLEKLILITIKRLYKCMIAFKLSVSMDLVSFENEKKIVPNKQNQLIFFFDHRFMYQMSVWFSRYLAVPY